MSGMDILVTIETNDSWPLSFRVFDFAQKHNIIHIIERNVLGNYFYYKQMYDELYCTNKSFEKPN